MNAAGPAHLVLDSPAPRSIRCLRVLASAFLLVWVAACGQDVTGGDAPANTRSLAASGEVDTGSVSVFLTDAPSDDFDEILVTIEKLQLLGDGPAVTLFKGRETIDLKDLENFSDLFVYAEHVPTGYFSKIRMLVSRIELVRDGQTTDAEVPANGKIDLVPGGLFAVHKDVTLVIELDIDAKKSIHVVGTGSGKYMFRPVIYVDIKHTQSPQKLARVHGEITEIFDEESFELCSTLFMASRYVTASTGHDEGGLGDRHRCMTVEHDADTGIFASNGDPTDAGALEVEDEVTVVGRFHLVDANHEVMPLQSLGGGPKEHKKHKKHKPGKGGDSDSDSESDSDTDTDSDSDTDSDTDGGDRPKPPEIQIVLLAYVIEIGPADAFLHLRGVIESELDDLDQFEFMIGSGQGFGDDSVVTALLQDGTRIFSRRGHELGEEEILPDTHAKIDGVYRISEALYKTALLILDVEAAIIDELRGTIVSTMDAIRRLVIDIDDGPGVEEVCVDVLEKADIFLIDEGMSKRIEFDELDEGQRVDVYGGYPEGGNCFVADTVIAFDEDARLCRRTGDRMCDPGQICFIREGSCDTDAVGVCVDEQPGCPDIFAPVCGCDGKTYANRCLAVNANVTVESEGECETADLCGGELECAIDELCYVRPGNCALDAVGVCIDDPAGCSHIFEPVCGCDDKSYGNECLAAKEGVTVESEGECQTSDVCDRTEQGMCKVGALCFVKPGNCDADAPGVCIEEPDVCPGILEPVCGCDGKNHVNGCVATKEGVTVEAPGFCAVTDACGGVDALTCDLGEFCLTPQGTCDEFALGKCVKEPAKCPDTDKPVCDCEGKPHTNICVALKAGARIAKPGDCR